jgi:DNA-binding protein HU-beta
MLVYNLYLEGVLTVNKNELIASIASETGLTKTDSAKALDAFVTSVTKALKKGGEVRLVGFGTFSVSKRAATTGRNPRTGATIKIAARKVAKFRPGKQLKDAV